MLGGGRDRCSGWQPISADRLLSGGQPPIRIGLLHSQTGSLAISEKSLLDAEILAIEEINADGGVAGRQVVCECPDCRSDPTVFAAEARRLIEQEKAVALFGCWTSECRKAVLPVVDESRSLLFFPGNFEGIETSRRHLRRGRGQPVGPAGGPLGVRRLNARRFFVVGLEEVWSRCGAEIAKDAIKAAGGELVGESYTVPLTPSVDAIVEAIRQAKPDVVLNFLFGESNSRSTRRCVGPGWAPTSCRRSPSGSPRTSRGGSRRPTSSASMPPGTTSRASTAPRTGISSAASAPGTARLGSIGDAMVAAYNSVKFWAQAASEVGPGDIGRDRQPEPPEHGRPRRDRHHRSRLAERSGGRSTSGGCAPTASSRSSSRSTSRSGRSSSSGPAPPNSGQFRRSLQGPVAWPLVGGAVARSHRHRPRRLVDRPPTEPGIRDRHRMNFARSCTTDPASPPAWRLLPADRAWSPA